MKIKDIKTVEDAQTYMSKNHLSLEEFIQIIYQYEDLMYPKPKPPVKPYLAKNANSKDAKVYAIELEGYETLEYNYAELKNSYLKMKILYNEILTELVKDSADLQSVPEQYRDKVYSKAYQMGHSSGLMEVHKYLVDLVEIFNLDTYHGV